MTIYPIWEVDLTVHGPISVERPITFSQLKGFRFSNPFYSDIRIRSLRNGVEATVTAYASNRELAKKAALLFFGQMLNVLALRIDQSLYLSLSDSGLTSQKTDVARRRVSEGEWQAAFSDARALAKYKQKSTFLRALGWYRKALHTEDPFDSFLAFWNSIEIAATKYHPPVPEGRSNNTKSYVWECFKALWGECETWPVVPGQMGWIDEYHQTRTNIAHGVASVDIEEIESVLARLPVVRRVAHRFLTDWWIHGIDKYVRRPS